MIIVQVIRTFVHSIYCQSPDEKTKGGRTTLTGLWKYVSRRIPSNREG